MVNVKTIKGIIPVCILTGMMFFACGKGNRDDETETASTQDADMTSEAWNWADSVMNTMTLEQQIGSMLMPATYTVTDAATLKQLRQYVADYHIGGILLLKGSPEEAKVLTETLQEVSSVPLWIAIDAEWGLGMRLEGASEFPANGSIRSDVSEEAMYEYGQEVGRECQTLGINMVMGPVMDVVPQFSDNPIGRRSFGHNPEHVSTCGSAYIRGLEDSNVLAVAKHFPGLGSADKDSHKEMAIVTKSKESFYAEDLAPFRQIIDTGLKGLMVGHVYVEALDSVRRPADMSPVIIDDLLRKDWHYNGLVITDAINMEGAAGYSVTDALLAGADIILAPANIKNAFTEIHTAVTTGKLSRSVIADRCRRNLFYKRLKGIPTTISTDSIHTRAALQLRQRLE